MMTLRHWQLWLRAAELMQDSEDSSEYNQDALDNLVPCLRELTLKAPRPAFQEAKGLLRECGVTLVLVPAVPGPGIHGATRWFEGRPLI